MHLYKVVPFRRERKREWGIVERRIIRCKHRKCSLSRAWYGWTRWVSIRWNWLYVEKVIRGGTSPFNLKRTIGCTWRFKMQNTLFPARRSFYDFHAGTLVAFVKRAEKYLYVRYLINETMEHGEHLFDYTLFHTSFSFFLSLSRNIRMLQIRCVNRNFVD